MKEFFKNNIVRFFLISSLTLNIGLILFFSIFIRRSDIPIVLHYNVSWGVDYFGEVKRIFILPIVGLIIFFLNGTLALRTWFRMKIVSYFLLAVILIFEIFIWLAGFALYMINS